jgi:acetyltransferase-like isoleucine patch superfamily enzyme
MKPAMTAQQAQFTAEDSSALKLYRELVVGKASLPHWLYYEFCTTLFSNLPGLLGMGARMLLFPPLFAGVGVRPAIGRGVLIRQPRAITLGKRVLVDEYAALDVRGENGAIQLGDFCSVGRYSSLVAKSSQIVCASGVNIGSYCRIATQSKIEIGESTLIAAYAYIGPGNHQQGDEETPLIAREMEIKGGVRIGARVWIGTKATILDGVTIGDGAIVGAHALVRDNVPAGATVVGVPARVVNHS